MTQADDKKPPREEKPKKGGSPAKAEEAEAPAPAAEAKAPPGEEAGQAPSGPKWEAELDSYPLREKSEDKRWAVRTVWTWIGVLIVSLTFIMTMLVLGAIHD